MAILLPMVGGFLVTITAVLVSATMMMARSAFTVVWFDEGRMYLIDVQVILLINIILV